MVQQYHCHRHCHCYYALVPVTTPIGYTAAVGTRVNKHRGNTHKRHRTYTNHLVPSFLNPILHNTSLLIITWAWSRLCLHRHRSRLPTLVHLLRNRNKSLLAMSTSTLPTWKVSKVRMVSFSAGASHVVHPALPRSPLSFSHNRCSN